MSKKREPQRAAGADTRHSSRYLPALLLLFVGSGCAALIYEIVWFQMIQLVIGSSAISLAVLLGTFMGGMCLGSIALPRYIGASRHPLKVYAALEAGIGLIGLLLLGLIPLVGGVYSSVVGHGLAGILLRAFFCVLLLLPPTILMGATLPAISRWIETTPTGVSWMGFFYGGNIAGAVLGCLLAGFYLLRVHDVATATFAALALNAVVALAGWTLARLTPYATPAPDERTAAPIVTPETRLVYVAIALSGMTALGAEVIWTRLLSLLLGATVYTFAIILAVFLTGLGVGSGVASWLARTLDRPRLALGICQLLLAAAIAWTAYMLSSSLPYWPVNPSITENAWMVFQMDLVRTIWAMMPPALLWGASFPFAVAAAAARGQDPARLLGGVYAANTVGAIVGALGFGMIAVPAIGTQNAQRTLIAFAVVSAVLMLVPALMRRAEATEARPEAGTVAVPARLGWVALGIVVAALLARAVPAVRDQHGRHGRYAPTYAPPDALYVGEGMNASVAVTQLEDGTRNFHVSGKIEASTEPQDMRLQRMLGHITALLHDEPKTVLVVGFGAGVTAGAFVLHPSVERIVICEIEPLIPRVVARYFGAENYNVLEDPRVEVVYDDARHYILTTKEKFDVITSDPIHPWVKGAATLYTREYFELAQRHLNPGGVMTQWVPLYESSEAVVKSEIATFFDVFAEGTIWANAPDGRGYDIVLAGKVGPAQIDLDRLQERLARPDHGGVAQSLAEVGFYSPFDLLGTYGGRGPDLTPWLADAAINRDRSLRLMYIAGMGNNLYRNAAIFDAMLAYARYPEELFVGSEDAKRIMRSTLGGEEIGR